MHLPSQKPGDAGREACQERHEQKHFRYSNPAPLAAKALRPHWAHSLFNASVKLREIR